VVARLFHVSPSFRIHEKYGNLKSPCGAVSLNRWEGFTDQRMGENVKIGLHLTPYTLNFAFMHAAAIHARNPIHARYTLKLSFMHPAG
jgi:hypothetical protein